MFHIHFKIKKKLGVSFSKITYKRHINIICIQYDRICAIPVSLKCLY